jgi:sarcosine oxidase/L-pipecolate oxidase
LESREEWLKINKIHNDDLYVSCGMLRVQPSEDLGVLEKETLANLDRDGLRHTQFVKSDPSDRQRASDLGWEAKLLDFDIPGERIKTFEAVLDSLSGLIKSSESCAYLQRIALSEGVEFQLGPECGSFDSLVLEASQLNSSQNHGSKRAIGIQTRDGRFHPSDTVVIAGESFV